MRLLTIIFLSSVMLFAEDNFYLLGTSTGQAEYDCYYHISSVGDINNDGFDDAIVGASAGHYVNLFFGSSEFDTIPDMVFRPTEQGSTFGTSTCCDDFNGDGFNDIAIGEPYWCVSEYPDGIFQAGKVWIYFGGPQLDTIPDLELVVGDLVQFTGWYYRFGSSIASGGDVNSDGHNDLIVSAPNDDYDAHGRVYIYFGGPDINDQYDILLEGEDHFDMFGRSIDIVGDIDQDGFDDILIGASQDLKGEDGQAYLIYGSNGEISLDSSVCFEGDSLQTYGSFGRQCSGLGDINGDKINDFGIMGAGYIYIISGIDLSIININTNRETWGSFHSIGKCSDVNKDGINDVLIGIENREDQYSGKLSCLLGSTDFDTIPDFEIYGSTKSGYLSYNIACLGDINNDGDPDFLLSEMLSGRGRISFYSFGEYQHIEGETIATVNEFNLYQNFPNPFNPITTINYKVPSKTEVNLSVYDMGGRLVDNLVNRTQSAGTYSVQWDASDYSSGVYFYKIQTDEFIQVNKCILIK